LTKAQKEAEAENALKNDPLIREKIKKARREGMEGHGQSS